MSQENETRNILDSEGNIIGTLQLPIGTSEVEWTRKLSEFLYIPPQLTQEEILMQQIKESINFGNDLLIKSMTHNLSLGITQSPYLTEITQYTNNLRLYLMSGLLPAAIKEIDTLIQNGVPQEYSPFITQELLEFNKIKIQNYLGL